MTVYKIVNGCNGCEIESCKQVDHNHMIIDSEEYQKVLKYFGIIITIGAIIWLYFFIT